MSTETMALTHENVEKVLDELRPFLMADGSNVEVVELDGPIVKCAAGRLRRAGSTMTLKMASSARCRKRFQVSEVVQVL